MDPIHSRGGEEDESYPLINGCRMYEVGWTKVCVLIFIHDCV